MAEPLTGTAEQLVAQLLARYEPLRDSRLHAEPEVQRQKLFQRAAVALGLAGTLITVGLLASGRVGSQGGLYGLALLLLAAVCWHRGRQPLRYVPPEPLDNLAPLAQSLGLCRALAHSFPEVELQLDPMDFLLQGSCDGYDWQVRIDRELLRSSGKNEKGVPVYSVLSDQDRSAPAASRIWRRGDQELMERIVWTVRMPDEFRHRAGQPSPHASLDRCQTRMGQTECVFTLPMTSPGQPGLGHEDRTDYISSPLGLHHPEFVGEQVALSLAWMFKPNLKL